MSVTHLRPPPLDDPADGDDLSGGGGGLARLTRGVVWVGLLLGVILLGLSYWAGITPSWPGLSGFLGVLAAFPFFFALMLILGTALAYTGRHYHTEIRTSTTSGVVTVCKWTVRQGARWGAAGWTRLAGFVAGRETGPGAGPGADDSPPAAPGDTVPGPATQPATDPVPAAGADATPAPATPRETPVTETTTPAAPAAPGTTRPATRDVPTEFRAAINWIDDFEPADDAELHDFLKGLAAGMHGIGASLGDLYELCTGPSVRIGKGGMSATHGAADAIADAAEAIAAASKVLAAYYAGVTEEVAAGVDLPKDGDFLTGEGDA